MSMRLNARRAALGLIAASAAVALIASLGGSASAGETECPAKTLCVFQDVGFGGEMIKIDKDGISNKLAKKMDNEASSVINNRNKRAYLYDKEDGKGDKFCLDPKLVLDSVGPGNDLASSSKNADNKKDCPDV